LLGSIAENGLHRDAVGHVHHRSRFGDRALARVQFDLDELHLASDDAEIDLVGTPAGDNRWRRRRTTARRAGQIGGQLRHILEWRPVRQAWTEDECVPVYGAVPQVRHHVVS
jgi:hypothetical protein